MCINEVMAVVVTYFPDEHLEKRLVNIVKQVACICVVDNTDDKKIACQIRSRVESLQRSEIHFVSNGDNLGIAQALNVGVGMAEQWEKKYLLTLDQDTDIPDGFVKKLVSSFQVNNHGEQIGIIAPNFVDRKVRRRSLFMMRSGRWAIKRKPLRPGGGLQPVLLAITSGSLYKTSVFKAVGKFREDYFIDYVDFEFCLRLWKAGFRVMVNPNTAISHSLGTPATIKIGPIKIPTHTHSPIRRYYITRNRVNMFLQYFFHFPQVVFYDILRMMSLEVVKIAFLKEHRLEHFKFYCKGFVHGVIGRMGKFKD